MEIWLTYIMAYQNTIKHTRFTYSDLELCPQLSVVIGQYVLITIPIYVFKIRIYTLESLKGYAKT